MRYLLLIFCSIVLAFACNNGLNDIEPPLNEASQVTVDTRFVTMDTIKTEHSGWTISIDGDSIILYTRLLKNQIKTNSGKVSVLYDFDDGIADLGEVVYDVDDKVLHIYRGQGCIVQITRDGQELLIVELDKKFNEEDGGFAFLPIEDGYYLAKGNRMLQIDFSGKVLDSMIIPLDSVLFNNNQLFRLTDMILLPDSVFVFTGNYSKISENGEDRLNSSHITSFSLKTNVAKTQLSRSIADKTISWLNCPSLKKVDNCIALANWSCENVEFYSETLDYITSIDYKMEEKEVWPRDVEYFGNRLYVLDYLSGDIFTYIID